VSTPILQHYPLVDIANSEGTEVDLKVNLPKVVFDAIEAEYEGLDDPGTAALFLQDYLVVKASPSAHAQVEGYMRALTAIQH